MSIWPSRFDPDHGAPPTGPACHREEASANASTCAGAAEQPQDERSLDGVSENSHVFASSEGTRVKHSRRADHLLERGPGPFRRGRVIDQSRRGLGVESGPGKL